MTQTSRTYKIAFIEPDRHSRYDYIPLGLGYISAHLKKYGQYQYETRFYSQQK